MDDRSKNPYASPLAPCEPTASPIKALCGILPNALSMDRLYKFYFTGDSLIAECIGGQFSNKMSARLLIYPVPIGLLLFLWRAIFLEGQWANSLASNILGLAMPAAALFVVAEAITRFCYDLRRKREARS